MMKAARNIAVKMCVEAASSETASTTPFTLNPADILTRAYLAVKASGEVEAGSTTACIVALTPVPVTQMPTVAPPAVTESTVAVAATAAATVALTSTTASAVVDRIDVGHLTPTSASIASFIHSAHSMSDLMAAMVDVNQNTIATEVGSEHVESTASSTSIALTSHAVSQPIAIPASDAPTAHPPVSVAIDVSPDPAAPSSPRSASLVPPSTAADAAAAHRQAMWSRDTVYLSAANLGDSGYMILRRDASGVYHIVQMSDLQRSGRTVKQLAIIPPRFKNDSYCDDSPEEAKLDAHLVKEDDLLILGSDGLWSDTATRRSAWIDRTDMPISHSFALSCLLPLCRDNLINGEWGSYTFFYGWRSQAEMERVAKQRKGERCSAA
jgi:hypothetical protein